MTSSGSKNALPKLSITAVLTSIVLPSKSVVFKCKKVGMLKEEKNNANKYVLRINLIAL